jgi:hypothetical protein
VFGEIIVVSPGLLPRKLLILRSMQIVVTVLILGFALAGVPEYFPLPEAGLLVDADDAVHQFLPEMLPLFALELFFFPLVGLVRVETERILEGEGVDAFLELEVDT